MRALAAIAMLATACGPTVDCTVLCEKTLFCEVGFQPADDEDANDDGVLDKVESGERSDAESCRLGCEESARVTVERASCVDQVELRDPAVCQEEVLACLELSSS